MGGTSEAHAAIDADLPPVSLAPWTVYAWSPPTNDSLGPARLVSEDYQKVPPNEVMVGPCPRLARGPVTRSWRAQAGGVPLPGDVARDRHRSPARVDQGLPTTAMRPRAIAALAIAIHADRVDAPFGRFSVVRRAYTVKR